MAPAGEEATTPAPQNGGARRRPAGIEATRTDTFPVRWQGAVTLGQQRGNILEQQGLIAPSPGSFAVRERLALSVAEC